MKLAYHVPEKIWWINNFLNYEKYKGIHNAIIKERKNINLHSAEALWQKNLTKNIIAPHRVEVSNYKPFEMLKTLVKHNPFFKLECKEMSTIIHYMKKGSGINWHDDNNWKYGATYYLNNRWQAGWGGEFMFTFDRDYGWIPPVGNSLVIVKAPITHKVNPVLTTTMPRISVQLFMK
jgi:Rps23 Pro-64 3,4-dihydroxylase Tpa1-like proline 4-hydroxylase